MQKLKRLVIGFAVAAITLAAGLGVAAYIKQRARANRCAQASYFPNGTLRQDRLTEWKTKSYAAMLEQPFTCFEGDTEVYRLLFLAAFENPTSIRIWRDGNQYQIAIKQLSDTVTTEATPRDLVFNVTRSLTAEQWNKVQELLNKANFWSMQSMDVRELGFDGVSSVLEGRKDGKYHVVDRWVPEDENFLELCGYLLEISKLTWKSQRRVESELLTDERFFSGSVMLPKGQVTHSDRESFVHQLERAIDSQKTSLTEIQIRAEAPEKDVIALYANGVTRQRCLDLAQSILIQRAAEAGFRTLSCEDKQKRNLFSTAIKNERPAAKGRSS
jgi:hypothetical protein